MNSKVQFRSHTFRMRLGATAVTLLAAILVSFALMPTAWAQTYKVLYNFTGGSDGAYPVAGLTMDANGTLYGITREGGLQTQYCYTGCGTVFKLVPRGSGWLFSSIYKFQDSPDGSSPEGALVVTQDGALIGTTVSGGYGDGTVFKLTPPATPCHNASCPWTETVIYCFSGSDGLAPKAGLVLDPDGNLYGTTMSGGSGSCYYGCGTAYKLSPAGDAWNYQLVYAFQGQGDGSAPAAGLTFDSAGALYGTAMGGTPPAGTVFQLVRSESGWSENLLYRFLAREDGATPYAGVILDSRGNVYGTTPGSGPGPGLGAGSGGTVFELSPSIGDWIFSLVHSFTQPPRGLGQAGPWAKLVMDPGGNLYGTTYREGAYLAGNVFKLTPVNGSWIYTSVYDFTGGIDGGYPMSDIILDAQGNLYGTAAAGGTGSACPNGSWGCGVVWQITP